jgi:hypothetical protein
MAHIHQKLAHLEQLLKGLPQNIPFQPLSSLYHFQPDTSSIEDKGVFGVSAHCLEVAFGTHALRLCNKDLIFSERGPRLEVNLMHLLRWTVKELPSIKDQQAFSDAWIDRLIQAAVASGGAIPSQKRYENGLAIQNDHFLIKSLYRKLSVTATSAPSKRTNSSFSTPKGNPIHTPTSGQAIGMSSPPQKDLFGKGDKNLKQSKLMFEKVSIKDYNSQTSKAFESIRKHAKQVQQETVWEKERRDEKKREQGAARARKHYWKHHGGENNGMGPLGIEEESLEEGQKKNKTKVRQLVSKSCPKPTNSRLISSSR